MKKYIDFNRGCGIEDARLIESKKEILKVLRSKDFRYVGSVNNFNFYDNEIEVVAINEKDI